MPIYEYVCRKCFCEFEALVRNTSSMPEDGCPECGSNDLQKKLSTFAAKVPAGTSASCPMQGNCPAVSHPTGGGCCCSGKCRGH